MAFNLPTPVSLHTDTALDNVGTIGSNMVLRTKTAGNLPITTSASRQQYNGNAANTAEGVFFGTAGQSTPGSIDMFLGNRLFIWSLQFNAPNRIQVDTLAAGGVRFWLGSGPDPKNNYREFFVGGNDTPFAASQAGPVTLCIDMANTTQNNTVGNFDQTQVSAYGIATVHDGIVGNQFGECFFQRSFIFNTEKTSASLPTFTGTSNFDDAVTLLQGTDYTNKIGFWITKAGSSFFVPCAFSLGNGVDATVFNDAGVSVVSPSSNTAKQENFRLTTDAMRVYLKMRDSALDTVVLSGSYSWGTAAPWDFDLSNNSTCTLSGNFAGMGTFTLGSSVTATGNFTLNTGSFVVCNGATINGSTINGSLRLQGNSVTTLNNVDVTGVLEFTVAGTYQIQNSTIAAVSNTSGGAVIIESVNSTIAGNQGPNIVIQDLRSISVTNIVAGSRLQIFNVTTNLQIVNDYNNTTSYIQTYAEGTDYSVGDVVRTRLTYTVGTTSYLEFETTTVATTAGWSVLAAQVIDTVYTDDIGIDGTAVTKFTADYADTDVNLNINQNFTIAEFYAWWKYNLTLSQGIADFFGVITALDEANFRINTSVLSLFLDSTATASVRQTDNRRIYRADLAYPVRQPTTGEYGLDVVWRNIIFVAPVDNNVPALTSAQSTQLAQIAEVLADTNDLQTNQGNFATAIGFNTVAPDNTGIGTLLTNLTTYTTTALPKITAIQTDTDEIQQNQTELMNNVKLIPALL